MTLPVLIQTFGLLWQEIIEVFSLRMVISCNDKKYKQYVTGEEKRHVQLSIALRSECCFCVLK